ncbi:MAG: hypothetical protein LRY71_11205 [Bacillaceae bacterium]|nr:hypothetical protein [Bacillaceae bacterium]
MNFQGYNHLNLKEQEVFRVTHKLHLATMGSEIREYYGLEQIKDVKPNSLEMCIEVSYKNGEFFKYFHDYTWG